MRMALHDGQAGAKPGFVGDAANLAQAAANLAADLAAADRSSDREAVGGRRAADQGPE